MEFEKNTVYLSDEEQRKGDISSPLPITSSTLAKLGGLVQGSVSEVNELMSGWDVIMHGEQIDLSIARSKLDCRMNIFRKVAQYAAKELPDLFNTELEEINTPKDFLETTR